MMPVVAIGEKPGFGWLRNSSGSRSSSGSGSGSGFAQTEHVLHVEATALAVRKKVGGAQRALRIRQPVCRLVRDLDPLANAREQHSVIANNVAAANGGKTDGRRIAFAGDALAGVHR